MQQEEMLEQIKQCILKSDSMGVKTAISAALDAGISSAEILSKSVTGAMQTVGELWDAKEFWLADVMAAAETVKVGIDYLKSETESDGSNSIGTVVIGSVKGDVHSVGKNLVATFLGASGFEVFDLGEDVSADTFIEAVKEHDADVLGLSCFATNYTSVMNEVSEKLVVEGLREHVFIMIGGISMDPEWVPKVGADAFARDAHEAAETARAHMQTVLSRTQ